MFNTPILVIKRPRPAWKRLLVALAFLVAIPLTVPIAFVYDGLRSAVFCACALFGAALEEAS